MQLCGPLFGLILSYFPFFLSVSFLRQNRKSPRMFNSMAFNARAIYTFIKEWLFISSSVSLSVLNHSVPFPLPKFSFEVKSCFLKKKINWMRYTITKYTIYPLYTYIFSFWYAIVQAIKAQSQDIHVLSLSLHFICPVLSPSFCVFVCGGQYGNFIETSQINSPSHEVKIK